MGASFLISCEFQVCAFWIGSALRLSSTLARLMSGGFAWKGNLAGLWLGMHVLRHRGSCMEHFLGDLNGTPPPLHLHY